MNKALHYDLIIVGGGLVGASLALALRHLPLKIALIDARLPSLDDARLFGLNISSVTLLKKLKVWDALTMHSEAIREVHVSCEGAFGALRLRAEEANVSELGYVVPAFQLETVIQDVLLTMESLTLYRPASLVDLKQNAETTTLIVNQAEETLSLTAPLIIGADGTESTLRMLLAIPTETKDYHQTAIVTRFDLNRPHHGKAYERFCDGGAIAMLPLPEKRCASIVSVDTAKANALLAMSDDDYRAYCQRHMGYRLGRLMTVGKRMSYPLRMKQAKQAVAGQVLLLGNALHTLHPIAAQGFNLALFEVACLVERIQWHLTHQQPLTASLLSRVNEHIQKQQQSSIFISDQLARLFSKPIMGLSSLAGLGMAGFDCFPSLKKQFITLMLGRANQTPALLMNH